jgi:hypothetical protein
MRETGPLLFAVRSDHQSAEFEIVFADGGARYFQRNGPKVVRFSGGEGFTAIYFDHENSISVKETPHHILGGLPASNLLSDDHK